MNYYFTAAVENLGITQHLSPNDDDEDSNDIYVILNKYRQHPSITKIKEYINVNESFNFNSIDDDDMSKEIETLKNKKTNIASDIPANILIESCEITSGYLAKIYNVSKVNRTFPASLKLANIKAIHKKKERTLKENYRPISLLPTVSKVFERIMYNQIYLYIEKHLSSFLFGFRKGYSTEECLIIMLEKWKQALDKKSKAGAILTDLSKAFDCLNHKLLIAKLHAYGFSIPSLEYIYSYLSERNQRTKIGSVSSSWKMIRTGVPQGSIFGPLLFNLYMNDIFLFIPSPNVVSYADDNTTYAMEKDFETLITTLENDTSIMMERFKINKNRGLK